jgi:hypothetical protein
LEAKTALQDEDREPTPPRRASLRLHTQWGTEKKTDRKKWDTEEKTFRYSQGESLSNK